MKILFSTFGSLGDIHPYLALALEAKSRGHHPILATSARYRAKAEGLGVEFRAVCPDLPDENEFGALAKRVMDGKRGPETLFTEILNPTLRQNYADLLSCGADVDVFITHPAALGGPLAAQKLNKIWISSALAPISLWSIYDPPTPPTLPQLDFARFLGPLWGVALKRMGEWATRNWVSEVKNLQHEEGIRDNGHPMFDGQHSPQGVLALFSPLFAAPQKDWQKNTRAVGFPFFDADSHEMSAQKEDLTNLLQAKSTTAYPDQKSSSALSPIVFTLGSSAVWDAGEFFHVSAEYTKRLGYPAIFLTGKPTGISWPNHVTEIAYAPYNELFPSARLVVHQGGIGTTAQCLRAGVPQLVMPYAHDQNDNARRVEKLNVGRKISRDNYARDHGEWAIELIASAIQSCCSPAKTLASRIQSENAPKSAVEFIEETARR